MATFGGIRGLAQAFLRSAAEKGLSFADAFNAMREGGLSTYRRTDMLKDYRQFLGIPDKADVLKYVRRDYRPSRDLYTVATGYQRANFRYQVDIDVYNRTTGESFPMSTNISSDVQLTRGDIEAAGLDAVKGSLDRSQLDVRGYKLFGAFAKGDTTWD